MSFFYFAPPPPSSILPPVEEIPTFERPADWLSLPDVPEGEQGFNALFAVGPGSQNAAAFTVSLPGGAGSVTVDWGDGVVESVNSGAIAQHLYDYDAISAPTTVEGFKQVIITMRGADLSIASNIILSLVIRNALYHVTSSYRTCGWLDMYVRLPYAQNISIGSSSSSSTATRRLRKVVIAGPNTLTTASNMFKGCNALEEVVIDSLDYITLAISMFENCYSLRRVVLPDTPLLYNTQYMFSQCYSLVEAPALNLSAVNQASYMFYVCESLVTVPDYDMPSVTNISYMFYSCSSLRKAPALVLGNALLTVASLFHSCYSLEEVGSLNLSAVTSTNSMFWDCKSLRKVADMNLPAVQNIGNMFCNCSTLVNAPNMQFGSALTVANELFYNCACLEVMPAYAFENVGGAPTYIARYCESLKRVLVTGLRYGVDLSRTLLDANELNAFFSSMGNYAGTGLQVITISGCPGATTCDRTIATAKGFTVVG